MIIEEGIVLGQDADGRLLVETQRRSACGSCQAQGGCGTAAIGKVAGARRNVVAALADAAADYRAGERVELGLAEGALVAGSAALYLAPLAGLLAGGAAGGAIGGELAATLAGLAGLAFGLYWTRGYARRVARDPRFQPVVLRRL